eukprot:6042664-Amphidinium_carterae.1
MDVELGLSLQQCCSIDSMHTLALGVVQQLVAYTIWACLKANMFEIEGGPKEVVRIATLQRLEESLFKWYSGPGRSPTLSKIDALTLRSIGRSDAPSLHFKASESLGLLRWLAFALPKLPNMPAKKTWLEAVQNLAALWNSMSEVGFVVPERVQEAL